MKKVFFLMSVVAVLMFAACGGGNKSADSAKEADKVEAAASSSNLDAYIKLIEKATPLLEKISKGDMEALQEYSKIAEDMTKIATELQSELASNPALMKKYTDAAQKFAEEAAKLSGQ